VIPSRAITTALSALLLLAAGRPGSAAEPAPLSAADFASRVGPVLERRCGHCHGAERQEGGLRLDTFAGLRAGGDSGPVIVPGSRAESLLVRAVGRGDEALLMPPGEALPADEQGLLVEWVEAGAPHPEGSLEPPLPAPPFDPVEARGFWSFRPVVRPPVPADGDPADPIDAFVRVRLAAAGLVPTPPADRATLLRRVTFDLTGLPPTPDEMEAFLADGAPGAFARVVDRLLASPHHGEHWGRHWLDVVRYADSNGLDENVAHGNAWRYRDWVIKSLNDDLPYDEFLRRQVAGDLLVEPGADPDRRRDLLTATGFLVLGPKVLAEGDQAKLAADIVDEQIDTFGRAFLGLSLGCARCHHHKFDPVSQDDYAALAGVFTSTRSMESLARIARWQENIVAPPDAQEAHAAANARVEAAKGEIAAMVTAARAALAAAGTDPATVAEDRFPEETTGRLAGLRARLGELERAVVPLDTAMGVIEGSPADARIAVRGDHLAPGRRVPRGVPVVLEIDGPVAIPAASSGRRELAAWLTDPRHPLTARVIVNRVWRWHFGRGLVASSDNFGRLGEAPVNQPLLDWLAAELIDSGWSLKALHRRIILSAAWQRSSDPATSPTGAAAADIDPDNHLRWRGSIRRLEAESIRDSLLAVGGRLDRTMGGSLLHVANRAFLFDHTSKDETRYDAPRRSVYMPVIRNHIQDCLWLFDATDGAVPCGDRGTSTVPSQSLWMMNGDLVLEVADGLTRSILAATPGDARARPLLLFRRVLARPPTAAEEALVQGSVARITARLAAAGTPPGECEREAWTAVTQSLLAANEFLFIR
jgi:hypothetical protein